MHARKVLWITVTVLVALVFTPVIGEFFVELARENGLYESPSIKIESIMNSFRWMLDQTWFSACFWFVNGCAFGVLLNYWLSRPERIETELDQGELATGNEDQQPSDSWRSVGEYKLWEIACLWVGLEPEAQIPNGHPAYPILQMLMVDITNYKLLSAEDSKPGIHIQMSGDTKDGVNMNTVVKRSHLLQYISETTNKPSWDFGNDESVIKPKPVNSRISLMKFFDVALEHGWDFLNHNKDDIWSFSRGLRQAGIDDQVQVWGRDHSPIAEDLEPLLVISAKYWETNEIDILSCLDHPLANLENMGFADENLQTTTHSPNHSQGVKYYDLHIDRQQALNWLQSEAKSYKSSN